MKNKTHILVFRLSAMGDVAMTVPVIRALAEQYPKVKITVVSRPFFKPFFQGIPQVNFFAIDLKKRHRGFFGMLRLFADLKELKVDYFADFHNVLRAQIVRNLFKISGVPVAALDKGRADKKALTRTVNKVFKPLPSMFDNHCATLQRLGFPVDLSHPKFPERLPISKEVLRFAGPKKEKWIGIAPFAQYPTKVYPLDLMQQVIDQLAEREEAKIFLFGGGDEETALLNQLKRDNTNVLVVIGKLKFQQEIVLIQNLDVMLSMDSGNAHIAAMMGTKVVTLWGATHPHAGFAPFNQPADFALVANREEYPLLPTSVYGNKLVEGYQDAMRTIAPDGVVAQVEAIAYADSF